MNILSRIFKAILTSEENSCHRISDFAVTHTDAYLLTLIYIFKPEDIQVIDIFFLEEQDTKQHQ